jgi:hypothetical protein
MSERVEQDRYEAPALTAYGTIEEWTQQGCDSIICVSIILP